MTRQLLTGISTPVHLTLEESEGKGTFAKGEFGRVDVPTQNGRIYGKKITQKNIDRLSESLSKLAVYGELDHPSDGKTKLSRASHILTSLHIDEDGRVIGVAKILDTPNGLTLQKIIEAGGAVGVSSRGFGTVTKANDGSGNENVNDDYLMKTYDFVADPAMATAYPDIFTEETDDEILKENNFTVEMLKSEFPELVTCMIEDTKIQFNDNDIEKIVKDKVKKLEKTIREEYEKKLTDLTLSMKDEAKVIAMEELNNDPEHVGAKAILQKISEMVSIYHGDADMIAIKDAMEVVKEENSVLKTQIEEVVSLAKIATYELIIEKRVGTHPFVKNIRTSLGDLSKIENKDVLDDSINSLIDEFKDLAEHEKSKNVDESINEEESLRQSELIESIQVEMKELKEKKDSEIISLKQELKTSMKKMDNIETINEENEQAIDELLEKLESSELERYKYESLIGKKNPTVLIRRLKHADGKDEVDEIIEEFGSVDFRDESLSRVTRKKVRGEKRLDEESQEKNIRKGKLQQVLDLPLTGITMSEFNQLSGNS